VALPSRQPAVAVEAAAAIGRDADDRAVGELDLDACRLDGGCSGLDDHASVGPIGDRGETSVDRDRCRWVEDAPATAASADPMHQ
jgi:hypothetical protein